MGKIVSVYEHAFFQIWMPTGPSVLSVQYFPLIHPGVIWEINGNICSLKSGVPGAPGFKIRWLFLLASVGISIHFSALENEVIFKAYVL